MLPHFTTSLAYKDSIPILSNRGALLPSIPPPTFLSSLSMQRGPQPDDY